MDFFLLLGIRYGLVWVGLVMIDKGYFWVYLEVIVIFFLEIELKFVYRRDFFRVMNSLIIIVLYNLK